jgi:hypothetical protein
MINCNVTTTIWCQGNDFCVVHFATEVQDISGAIHRLPVSIFNVARDENLDRGDDLALRSNPVAKPIGMLCDNGLQTRLEGAKNLRPV